MEKKLVIGLAVTLSGRWPRELPEKRLLEYGGLLKKAFPACIICAADGLVCSGQDVEDAAETFKKAGVDIMVMVYGAFTGDDIPVRLCELVKKPIVLWAPYEPPFSREDRLYANALVALTMNSASLKRLAYATHTLYGDFADVRVAKELQCLVRVYGARKAIANTLLGLFGYRPTAFYNSTFDEALIRRTFGVRMEETDLKVVFDEMTGIDSALVNTDMQKVSGKYATAGELPEGHLENHSRLFLALKNVMARQGYDYATLKCWPEMGALHTTPCAVLGRLADEGVHIGCEGDVDAELAQIAQNALTGLPTFITDMINIDENENSMTFWHCGNAAPSLHDTASAPELRNHPLAGQGTAFWTALRPGDVTIARFYNYHGEYRLFLMKGTAIQKDRYTRGTMANVVLGPPVRQVAEAIIKEEIPHHYSLVWADVADEMRMLAELLDIPVVEM